MKFAEINELFTDKVKKYLNEGYVLHPYTMAGHQGEIAKIDLRNDHEIIRVWLQHVNCERRMFRRGIALYVGRETSERYLNEQNLNWSETLWCSKMEIIEERTFWQMQRDYRETDWYIEGEDGLNAMKIGEERVKNRYVGTKQFEVTDEKTIRLCMKLLRKKPGHKTRRTADVEKFTKCVDSKGKPTFYAKVNGSNIKVA